MTIKGLTPGQQILLDYVKTLVGANPTYINLFYQGGIIGSEFLTYSAKKLYMAFEFEGSQLPAVEVNSGFIHFYDQADALFFILVNEDLELTAADVANYNINNVKTKNIYFSRLNYATYHQMKFIGIKITWP
jgi:hypothetical protein